MNLNNYKYYQHHLVAATYCLNMPVYMYSIYTLQFCSECQTAANAQVRCVADGGACWSPHVYRELSASPASASPGGNISFLRMGA